MNNPHVALGEVADFVNGAAFKPEDWGEDGLPIIRIQNLTDSGKTFNYTERVVPEKLVVNPGDLLVSWSATLGVFRWNGPRGLLNQHIFRVLPNDEVVDKNYLRHALGQAINAMERHLHGATMKHVNRGEFLGTRIPLPPLEEQRRIAAILDKCHDLHGAREKRRGLLASLRSSYFKHLFGDPSRASENWPLKSIKSCSRNIQTGPFGSLLHQSDYIQSGVPIINPKHIANGAISHGKTETISRAKAEELSSYRLKKGDILLARRGEMGRCAEITSGESGYICGTGSMFIRPLHDVLEPAYLAALLSSSHLRRKLESVAIGTTLLNLNGTIVGEMLIPVPPIELQAKYALLLARLEAVNSIASRSVLKFSAASSSIQNIMFLEPGR
jgi:type I restriction enzyme S subunit